MHALYTIKGRDSFTMRRKITAMLISAVAMMSLVVPASAETKSELGYYNSHTYVATSQGSTTYVTSELSYNWTGRLKIQGMISTGIYSDTYFSNEIASGSSLRASRSAASGQKFIESGSSFFIDNEYVKYIGVGCL